MNAIEKLTGRVMQDDKARADYLAIKATETPLQLQNVYQQAAVKGCQHTCLAIELHVRQLAQIHFKRDDVREALRIVETTPKRWGTNGSADLKAIAAEIERQWREADFTLLDDGRALFEVGAMRIKCKCQPGAVAILVAKYRRGLPRRNWKARK